MSNKETMGQVMQNVTMSFIQDHFEVFAEMKKGNFTLVGLPGIGKTEILLQLSRKYLIKKNAEAINLSKGDYKTKHGHSVKEISDLQNADLGVFKLDMSQVPTEGLVMMYLDPNGKDHSRLQRENIKEINRLSDFLNKNPEAHAEFFVDELASATQDDQRTLMNFINDGHLPDGQEIDVDRVHFILATNPSADMPGYDDYDGPTNPIENAVITRGMTFFVRPDRRMFLEYGREFDDQGRQNIHPYIISALESAAGQDLFIFDSDKDVRSANPRTFKILTDYLYTATDFPVNVTDSKGNKHIEKWNGNVVKASIGDEAGSHLIEIINKLDKLLSLEELFSGKGHVKKELLTKFESYQSYERNYILLSILSDKSSIRLSQKENVIKFKDLLTKSNSNEILAVMIKMIYGDDTAKSKNAASLNDVKWFNDDDTAIIPYLAEKKRGLEELEQQG